MERYKCPWEKRGIRNLIPLVQGPEWGPRLPCRKKDKDAGKGH